MSTIPVQVALVDQSRSLEAADVDEVSGALNQQIADFQRLWRTHYHVSVVAREPSRVQAGTWQIKLQDSIDDPDALGYHSDEHNQPYAVVDVSAGDWTITASHELLEMVGDPFGNSMHLGAPPRGWQPHVTYGVKHVRYLREACDPCEAFSYEIGGVAVSDFLTLDWYGRADRGKAGYSFLGRLHAPGEVAPGGYVSWVDPLSGHWWQRFADGSGNQDKSLGRYDRAKFASLREFTDAKAREFRA